MMKLLLKESLQAEKALMRSSPFQSNKKKGEKIYSREFDKCWEKKKVESTTIYPGEWKGYGWNPFIFSFKV